MVFHILLQFWHFIMFAAILYFTIWTHFVDEKSTFIIFQIKMCSDEMCAPQFYMMEDPLLVEHGLQRVKKLKHNLAPIPVNSVLGGCLVSLCSNRTKQIPSQD